MARSKGLNERALFLQQEDADKGGFNNAARQQYQDASLPGLPSQPFYLISLSTLAAFRRGKIAAPYIQNKRLSESGPCAAHPRDVICARAPATQSSRGFIGGAARLKEEKTRKRKRKRAIGLTSGSPQGAVPQRKRKVSE